MSTDQKGTRLLARTFFNQLRASGYSSNQVIGVATELLDLVTEGLKDQERTLAAVAAQDEAAQKLASSSASL